MKKAVKILHTLPSVLILATFLFPRKFPLIEFKQADDPMFSYYFHMSIVFVIIVFQIVILLRKIRSYKNVEKSIKSKWTGILLMYNTLGAVVFVWSKVDELELLNSENESTQS